MQTQLIVPLAISLLVAACASGPTPEQLASADYGRDLTIAECESIAQSFIAESLKDPGSAQFRGGQCYRGNWGSVPVLGMGVEFGWIQKGQVNGKNAYGGYVGFRSYQVLIRNGSVIRYCISNADGICFPNGR